MNDAADGWGGYRAAIEEIRAGLHALDAAREPGGVEAADRLLLQAEAAAYNLVIAPDPATPRLLTQSVFLPGSYDWMLPNPDFFYRYLFVDGSRGWRLTGRPGNARFLEAQPIGGFFGDPAIRLHGTHDLDRMLDADGLIEVRIGPEPPADGGHWIPTEPGRLNTVLVREAQCDWPEERLADLTIAPIGPAGEPFDWPLADRLRDAARFLRFAMATFGPGFCQDIVGMAGENGFRLLDTSRDEDGANPNATYIAGCFALAGDDALLIEFDRPEALYWGLQLGDRWSRTLDYGERQSSLNDRQAITDADGTVRLVIAARDPGVANWLDSAGLAKGMMLLRWYRARRTPVPRVTRLPVADVAARFADSVHRVSPRERQAHLAERRAAVRRRYCQ